MKYYTVGAAATVGKCSRATIHKAIKDGLITSVLEDGRRKITMPAIKIYEIVKANFPRARPHNKPKVKPSTPTVSGLPAILQYAAMPEEKRTILLALGEKYTAEELTLLLNL